MENKIPATGLGNGGVQSSPVSTTPIEEGFLLGVSASPPPFSATNPTSPHLSSPFHMPVPNGYTSRWAWPLVSTALILFSFLGAGAWLASAISGNIRPVNNALSIPGGTLSNYNVINLPLNNLAIPPAEDLQDHRQPQLLINGQVQITNGLILSPVSSAPPAPTLGELYYDQTTNQPYYFDGKGFISIKPAAQIQGVSSVGSLTGKVALGPGLTVSGGALTTTLQPGITSITGTPDQVLVSATSGSVALALPQDIATTSRPTFAALHLASPTTGGALTLQSGSLASDLTLTLPTGDGSPGQCLSTDGNGHLNFINCVSGGSVSSVNGLSGTLTIADASTSGTTITVNDASTSQKGLAQFNSTNFIATGGIIDTIQDLATASSPTFANITLTNPLSIVSGGTGANSVVGARMSLGVAQSGANADITSTSVLNTITPTNTLTIGVMNQSFVLQGNKLSTLTASDGSHTTTIGFADPVTNTTLTFPTLSAGTYSICTTSGNCSNAGGGVTTSGGTIGLLPKFTSVQGISNSIISDNGSAATIAGSGVVQGAGGLTIGVGSSITGKLVLQNSSNNNTLTLQAGATSSMLTFLLPTSDGSNGQCLSTNGSGVLGFESCLTGSGSGGGVSSLNGLVGALTVANSTSSGSTLTINDASVSQKGIAQFNPVDFTASSGVIDTIQSIAASASPNFSSLSITGGSGITVGTGTTLGAITLRDGNAAFYGVTVEVQPPLTNNQTLTIPNATGTICLQNAISCGFASATGSGNYIQSQNSTDQTANFRITGSGQANTSILTPLLDSASAVPLNVGTTNATQINLNQNTVIASNKSLAANGSALFKDITNSTTAFRVQNASSSNLFTVDTTNGTVVLGNDGTPAALTVRGGAASGSNAAGTNITFDASNGTATGGSGDLIFRTATATANPITLDATSHATASSQSSLTWSHTTTSSQSNLILIVGIGVTSPTSIVSSVTYNGVALTKIGSTTCASGGNCDEELWYVLNPSPGTHTVVVTLTSNSNIYGGAATYYNVNQTTPLGTVATNAGGSNPSSVTVNSNPSQTIVDGIMEWSNGGLGSASSGQTQLWLIGGTNSGGSSKPGGISSTTLGWAINFGNWAEVAVPINPVANTTPDTLTDRLHITAAGNVGISNSNPQYTLDVTGVARIQTSTNSTTAFQVQNASGTAILVADTTSMKVTVNALVVSTTLTVNGHIITGGSTPTIAAGSAACTSPTVNITGDDTAGTITITTGSGCSSSGQLVAITFNSAFSATPHVVLTAENASGALLPIYDVPSTAGFTISTPNTPANTTTYTYQYTTLQ